MTDPALALTHQVQQAMGAAFGREFADADPVVRPANKKQTSADLQVNAAMALAKRLGRKPREVAQAIVDHLDEGDLIEAVEIAGPGFLNVTLSTGWIAGQATAMQRDPHLGTAPPAKIENIPVDYSSPNVAKEMHVGHLRTTVVGDSLVRTLEFLGHHVSRENHVGDWGTPFGMLIEHLLEAGETSDEARLLEDDPNEFYKHANAKFKAAEGDPTNDFDDRARRRVTLLQGGDEETLQHWNRLMDRSKTYFNRIYTQLGVTLTDDDLSGESQYNDELEGICTDLEAKGIARIDNGALCVFLDGYTGRDGQPLPLIIRKSDGGYGYAITDIATVRHYSQDLLADRAVYVVGAPQNLHFRMAWDAARVAGYVRPQTTPIHVQIGNVLGKDGKILRTRSGDSMRLQGLVDEALDKAAAVVAQSRPDLSEQERAVIAHQVGIGAIKYADLSVSHDSEYVFDLDRMLALTGNTGPYLQYATARITSILGRADTVDPAATPIALTEPAERALALKLLDFGPTVHQVGDTLEPHRLAAYLFELAQAFTSFYEQCPVLKAEDAGVRDARLALVALTGTTLTTGLGLLGIESPDQM